MEEDQQRPLTLAGRMEVELLQWMLAVSDRRIRGLPAFADARLAPRGRIAQREGKQGGQARHRHRVAAGELAA
jgi:hypothetical protein